jgi:hypothetical protein
MLLAREFSNPQMNLTLEVFLRMIEGCFKEELASVILYGAIAFDDLAPGYGDLDFLAVVEGDLSEEACQQLIELRKPLHRGTFGILSKMLEGAFLPRRLLNPAHTGKAFWWGTSGERTWENNQLDWFVPYPAFGEPRLCRIGNDSSGGA